MATRIGFLGCGKMAQALVKGLVSSGTCRADELLVSDIVDEGLDAVRSESGVARAVDNADLVRRSDVVVVAVKPQSVDGLLEDLRGVLTAKHLVVSIAAGVTLARLAKGTRADQRIVRVMPNTPCLVGEAASAYATSASVTEQDAELVDRLFSSVGLAYRVAEPLLDAVTGLSGSGPAYVYQVIEALSDGGVRCGLPRSIATSLAAQTVLGAAKMVLATGKHPGELKDMVTSPAGTTIAGLAVLEERGVRGAFIDAVDAATRRSRELGAG
jgi:pyrroline-5-carboxylate reductase